MALPSRFAFAPVAFVQVRLPEHCNQIAQIKAVTFVAAFFVPILPYFL